MQCLQLSFLLVGINCYLCGIIFISGEMTSILQSQLVYGTVPPQTHCPRWACAPGLVKKEHCIPSVRDSDTDAWPNWSPKDTGGLCGDVCENLECFGLNSLPGVLVLHKAWKGRSVEGWQQTREESGILMTWIAPLHLPCFPDISVIVSVFPFFWLY